ncbi:MAG: hypothetical protein HZB23_15340 [Deltaproteobacteria bacterium]|nr:hypothetical protein [Deltaproteobacteria bacterium]
MDEIKYEIITAYLFIFGSIFIITLGFYLLTMNSLDIISYHDKSEKFQHIKVYDIQVVEKYYIPNTSSNYEYIFITRYKNKNIALLSNKTFKSKMLIKRTENLDGMAAQLLNEFSGSNKHDNIESYEYINNIILYFIFKYLMSTFIILFGGLFAITGRAVIKKYSYYIL